MLSDQDFDALISRAMDELPQQYIKNLQNVAIVQADDPTEEQKQRMHIDNNHLLLGLYEGQSIAQRGLNFAFTLPDKITLFKNPLLAISHTPEDLFANVKQTLWHEMAHYYGLDHEQMDALQARDEK